MNKPPDGEPLPDLSEKPDDPAAEEHADAETGAPRFGKLKTSTVEREFFESGPHELGNLGGDLGGDAQEPTEIGNPSDPSAVPTRIRHAPPTPDLPPERRNFRAGQSRDEIPSLGKLADQEIEATATATKGGRREVSASGVNSVPTETAPAVERPGRRQPSEAESGELSNPALGQFDDEPARSPRRGGFLTPKVIKIGAVALAVVVIAVAAILLSSHRRTKAVAEGQEKALALMRVDTFQGYALAAQTLEPLASVDPLDTASLRSFALAMRWVDYHDEAAYKQAVALLVEPERAQEVPAWASLAHGALELGNGRVGNAAPLVARGGKNAWSLTLVARTAYVAGSNLESALEPLGAALQLDPQFVPALVLQGDVLRRLKKYDSALATYQLALKLSPKQPRAAFGVAKLALAGKASSQEAESALAAILEDREATPVPERARAALHFAALKGRDGDRAGANAALDKVGLEPATREWLQKAAAQEEVTRGEYRVVDGAPPAAQSVLDDDPYVPLSLAPPRQPPPPGQVTAPPEKAKPQKGGKVKKGAKKKPAKGTGKKKKR